MEKMINNPKLGRFYLIPKIRKRFSNLPGRSLITSSEYFTEHLSAFLEYHVKSIALKVKSYIKDTNR